MRRVRRAPKTTRGTPSVIFAHQSRHALPADLASLSAKLGVHARAAIALAAAPVNRPNLDAESLVVAATATSRSTYKIRLPEDPRQIALDEIEDIAEALRRAWNLGDGPISNVIWLLENKGIVVAKTSFDAKAMDGLSAWLDDRPYILVSDDVSAVRTRFDVAHELGHLILHKSITETTRNTTGMHQFLESQAHRFAAAFTFPRRSFARETVPGTLDHFVQLKPRWRLSVKMMIHRTADLDLASEEVLTTLYRRYSWRRWASAEPMDNEIEQERPRLLAKAMDLILTRVAAADVSHELGLSESEICRLCSLRRNELTPGDASVIPFRRSR